MPSLAIAAFLNHGASTPILDVRSPSEYAAGHIVGAVSMPLFSDEERAVVGTAYKQQGHLPAFEIGIAMVGPKMAGFVAQARQLVGAGGALHIYCWRGGMRSGSVAWLLAQAGFDVQTLRGGYKAYRHYVQAVLGQAWPLRVLAGPTGSGKTDVLLQIAKEGGQVIDLEGLACHKGSSFGGIGQKPQPRVEDFENQLATQLLAMDATKPIWLEDESQGIGKVFILKAFYEQMQKAPVYALETTLEQRIARLVQDYAMLPQDELAAAIIRLQTRLGPQHAKAALAALAAGDYAEVARIALVYYDKAYKASQGPKAGSVTLLDGDLAGAAKNLLKN